MCLLKWKPITVSIRKRTCINLDKWHVYLLMACSSSVIPVSLNALFDSAKLRAIALWRSSLSSPVRSITSEKQNYLSQNQKSNKMKVVRIMEILHPTSPFKSKSAPAWFYVRASLKRLQIDCKLVILQNLMFFSKIHLKQ